jgi:hypothetical protein
MCDSCAKDGAPANRRDEYAKRRMFDAHRGQMYNGMAMNPQESRIEVLLEQTDDGYFSRVRHSPVGPAAARFAFSVTRRELDALWLALDAAHAAGEEDQRRLAAQLEGWGARLFGALFADDVLVCLRASQQAAFAAQSSLRIQLDLDAVPEVQRLPWEVLYDTGQSEYLGLSLHSPMARYAGLMHRLLPAKLSGPLRALVAVASPAGYPAIDVQREWLGLLDEIDYLGREKKLYVEWLQKPTLFDLQRRLRQGEYHILHFVGHSAFGAQTGEGQLVFEDEIGRSRAVSGQHLGAMLRDHFPLRLVVLTDSAAAPVRGEGRAFLHVARSLVQRNVGAALATQFPMPREAQLRFMARFYAEIAAMKPVDEAVLQARLALREEGIWWGAPALKTRVADGQLFDDGTAGEQPLPASVELSIAARLNSLRIRTANLDTMARWGTELPGPKQ